MAITQVGSTTSATTTDPDTTLVITKPTGVAADDIMIAGITSNNTAQGAPSGWTEFEGQTGEQFEPDVAWQVRLYWKLAGGSEGANYTWTVGDVGPSAGFINAWRGVHTTSPIDATQDTMVNGNSPSEPDNTPSATAVNANGRAMYVRAVRRTSAGGSTGTLSEAVAGVTTQVSVGGLSSSGNTAYVIGSFSNDTDYSTTGSKSGIAVSYSATEATHYDATYLLRAAAVPATGTFSMSLAALTSSFAATRTMAEGPLSAQIPSITSQFAGTAAPPEGSLSTTLPSVSASFAGDATGGSFSSTLAAVTSQFEGAVNPIGTFASQLGAVTAAFTGESRKFGEHVISVEADHRAFLVTDEDTGLIPIKRSQVTDA